MAVLSKFGVDNGITQTLGVFDSVPYTCQELAHPWNSSCWRTWVGAFYRGIKFSLKVYAPLFTLRALMKLGEKNTDKRKLAKNAIFGILRSSLFLGINGTLFIVTLCAYRSIFGAYHGFSGLIVGSTCSILAILIERKSRRDLLGLYVFGQALETMFNMAVYRGHVTRINRGEIYLFAAVNLVYMMLFRSARLPSHIQSVLEKCIGNEETKRVKFRKERGPIVVNTSPLFNKANEVISNAIDQLNRIGPDTPPCVHSNSCLTYVTIGAVKYFSIGYVLQIVMGSVDIFRAVTQRKLSLLTKCFTKFSLANFFCAYITLFRVVNCLLRWAVGRDHPEIFGGIAGIVSGLSAHFYPSASITMFAFTKLLDILCMRAVDAKWLPFFPNFSSFIYSASMGLIAQASLFEVHNVPPSYWRFLLGLSGGRMSIIFRLLLDKYGTDASKLYPNFIPQLPPRIVKTDEVRNLLALNGK